VVIVEFGSPLWLSTLALHFGFAIWLSTLALQRPEFSGARASFKKYLECKYQKILKAIV